MSRRHLAMLVALCAIWGASFMLVKVAVRDLAPAVVVLGRVGFATLALLVAVPLLLPVRETAAQLRGAAGPLIVNGLLSSAIPFWLLSWGETRIDSGLAALLQASAPLFTALLAFFLVRSERVSGGRLAGVVVGFAGVALLVGAAPRGSLLAALAVVGTGLSYGAAALWTGSRLGGVRPRVGALGTMIVSTLVVLPAGLAQLPAHAPGWKALGAVVALGVLGSGVAYVLYFALIAGAGASRAILVTYLVPPTALGYGALLLGEHVGWAALAGLALVLVGVALGAGLGRLGRLGAAAARLGP